MRLSTALIYQNGLNGVLNQEAAMARLQEQLSSGRRVLTPADDPLAAALAINVSQTSSMNSNYDANRKQAEQALGAQTNTLQSVVKNMQEMLKRVVEAGNGTMSDADRQALVIALKARARNWWGWPTPRMATDSTCSPATRALPSPTASTPRPAR